MSELKVNKISPRSGTTITLGDSGDAVALGSGASVSGLTLSDNILFNAASKGIYLGVTTATASNLLDDYEEGTWTPELGGTTTDPSVVYQTTFTNGGYIKIGRQVTITGQIRTGTGTSGGVGALTLKNLPFNVGRIGTERGVAGNILIYNVPLPASTIYINLYCDPGSFTGYFQMQAVRDNTSWTTVDASVLTTTDIFVFTATYFTN